MLPPNCPPNRPRKPMNSTAPDPTITEPLSAHGRYRRENMLAELDREMAKHRRRRRIAQRATLASLIILPLIATAMLLNHNGTTGPIGESPEPVVASTETHEELITTNSLPTNATASFTIDRYSSERSLQHSKIVLTSTSSTVEQWMAAGTSAGSMIEVIDDDELLRTLNAINRPTGLIRTAERTWLTRPVTDAELNIKKKQGMLPDKFRQRLWA